MSNLTFSAFNSIVEDAQADVQKILTDISAIDAKLAQLTGPLMARKLALSKQLQSKQQQAAAQNRQQAPNAGMTTATSTPGGGGQGTPGGGQQGMPGVPGM